jgi:hypothetical protein
VGRVQLTDPLPIKKMARCTRDRERCPRFSGIEPGVPDPGVRGREGIRRPAARPRRRVPQDPAEPAGQAPDQPPVATARSRAPRPRRCLAVERQERRADPDQVAAARAGGVSGRFRRLDADEFAADRTAAVAAFRRPGRDHARAAVSGARSPESWRARRNEPSQIEPVRRTGRNHEQGPLRISFHSGRFAGEDPILTGIRPRPGPGPCPRRVRAGASGSCRGSRRWR